MMEEGTRSDQAPSYRDPLAGDKPFSAEEDSPSPQLRSFSVGEAAAPHIPEAKEDKPGDSDGLITSNGHILEHEWTFWCDGRQKDASRYRSTAKDYQQNLKAVITVNTIEMFWQAYKHLIFRPCDVPINCNMHFFKRGIQPMWEDENNRNGGKWVLRMPPKTVNAAKAEELWERTLLALIGELLDSAPSNDVCGAVLSRRKAGDRIAVWNRSKNNQDVVELGSRIKVALGLEDSMQLEYQAHEDSIKTGQSYSHSRLSLK